jgi:hypothetical protein
LRWFGQKRNIGVATLLASILLSGYMRSCEEDDNSWIVVHTNSGNESAIDEQSCRNVGKQQHGLGIASTDLMSDKT